MVVHPQPSGDVGASAGRRDAILAAATELFADAGFGGASVQDIADAAGVHKTTVLYHFATKDALHEAVLDMGLGAIARVMREFIAGPFDRTRLAYLLDQEHAFFAANRPLARLLARELLEQRPSEAYLRHFIEPIYRPAVESFRAAVQRGLVRAVDPAYFVHDAHVLLISYFCHTPLLERLQPGVDLYGIDALIARREHLVDQMFRMLDPTPARAERKGGGRKSPATTKGRRR